MSSRGSESGGMILVELADADFARMLRGEVFVRPGLTQPPGGVAEAHVLRHVRQLAAQLQRDGYAGGHWMMVADGEIVGLCGIAAPPSREGEVELGYGVAASRRLRGHASAAVGLVIETLRPDATLRAIVAVTRVDNVGSQRALERNGFRRAGTRNDPAEGKLLVWKRHFSDG